MPAYGTGSVTTAEGGRPIAVWSNETPATSGNASYSQAVGIRRNDNLPNCISVELAFAADPGTFSLEVQFADTDQDKYYVSRSPAYTTGLNAQFVGRIEIANVIARFARLHLVSRTNSVAMTATIS